MSIKMHPILKRLKKAITAYHAQPERDNLVPVYGAKILEDGAIVYEIEYVNSLEEAQKFGLFLRKVGREQPLLMLEIYSDESRVSIVIKSEVSA